MKSKKIDPDRFRSDDRELFHEFKELFDQVHPNSFVQQKLFLINKTRRKYRLEEKEEASAPSKPQKIKPKIVPKKPKLS